MNYIYFGTSKSWIPDELQATYLEPMSANWIDGYYDWVYEPNRGNFVIPRFIAEHDFGDRAREAGFVEKEGNVLVYPRAQCMFDESFDFFKGYWLQLLRVAQRYSATFPLNYVEEYPGGPGGVRAKAFVAAALELLSESAVELPPQS